MANDRFEGMLRERVLIVDGAMGTMIYGRGVFVNTCFDELNLTRPDLVEGIHRDYIEAGCDIIETNTFGANAIKLARFGLGDKVARINTSGVEIARRAAGNDVLVAGAIGPSGVELTAGQEEQIALVRRAFMEQAGALAEAGADLLILETFETMHEMVLAIEAVREAAALPIAAQLSVDEDRSLLLRQSVGDTIRQLAEQDGVRAVGFNCSQGPAGMLELLREARAETKMPISVQPNAGYPQEVDGRSIYMCTPEYMAEYAKRFYEHGARIIGGCCGTTPSHIREIARAVRALDRAAVREVKVRETPARENKKGFSPVPLEEKSLLGAKLASGKMITTIEITPPRGTDVRSMLEKVELCAEHGIDAINIPDGPRASSRLSPLVTAIRIRETADIEPILHVCCRDRNILGMQSEMLGAETMGLKNVLLVTGDPPKLGEYPDATAVFDLDSIALTGVVSRLNRGIDIAGGELPGPLALTIGVGANPVASDMKRETERFIRKVQAGAEYAVTQPVFDAETLYAFMEAVEDFSIPMIAGIWPFTSYKNAEFMANEVPGVVVPPALLDCMNKAKTKEQGRRIGIEIAREMITQLTPHVDGFAVSAPFGNVRIALAVLGKIGIEEALN